MTVLYQQMEDDVEYRIDLQSLKIVAPIAAATLLFAGAAQAGNTLTFGANSNNCGGAVICSYDGTTGYLNNGMGQPFNLSTIDNWFQVDAGGLNLLPGKQSMPEPDKGAGSFLVTNDTGSAITSFTLTLNDDFTSRTASVHTCTGAQKGNICDNFAAHGGSGNFTYDTELSGVDWDHCTQGAVNGQTCTGNAGGAAADFAPGSATYTWTAEPGKSIPAGSNFTISFSGWNNDGVAYYSSCDNVAGNLIQNCGFETGDLTDWNSYAATWPGFTFGISTDANSGNYAAEMSGPACASCQALLAYPLSLVSGVTYVVTFYVKALAYGSGDFSVNMQGDFSNGWQPSASGNYSDWTKESFTVTANEFPQILVFNMEHQRDGGPSQDWLIDDVSVVAQ